MATKKVLACSHSRSLQLLRTAGGNQVKLNARSEFESRQRGGVKLVVQQAVLCTARRNWMRVMLFRKPHAKPASETRKRNTQAERQQPAIERLKTGQRHIAAGTPRYSQLSWVLTIVGTP